MSFESVWGFDPDEVIKAQKFSWRERNVNEPADDSEENLPPHMPPDFFAQIYELRRMFGL